MGPDDGDDAEPGRAGPPLPPDDRLWRHPSELNDLGLTPPPPPVGALRARRSGAWSVAVAAAVTGAVVATGVIALTTNLSPRVVERPVIEKVAVTPLISSPMLRNDQSVAALVDALAPSIVRIEVEHRDGSRGTGSGVVFRDDGLVLTSAGLLAEVHAVDVVLPDGQRVAAEVVGRDVLTDVAVLDVDAARLPVAVLGSEAGLGVGSPAIVVGAPTAPDAGPTVLVGMITALGRKVQADAWPVLHGMIETDAAFRPGAAGGALVDVTGTVVGITTAATSEPAARYATPVDVARRVADRILAHGRMVHGWLGIEGADLPPVEAGELGVPGGAIVHGIIPAGPAATVGLTPGDVITEVGGRSVASISAVIVELRRHDPGEQIVVGYWRDGRHQEATVTIGERPPG